MDETLPRELMLEIFSRLPAVSLAQFRCVCKQWKRLIDDPSLPEATVFLTKWYDWDLKTSTGLELITEHDTSPKRVLDQFPSSGWYSMASSCKGLVCFSRCDGEGEEVLVFNPLAGGERVILPPPTVKAPWPEATRYGLGYDSSTKKYKVIRLYVRNYGNNRSWFDMGAEVYTMGMGATSSWREISQPPDSVAWLPSVYASGHQHWPVDSQEGGSSNKRRVISFDFKQEKFSTIIKEDQFPGWFKLIDLGGYLGVIDLSSETQFEIWKLKNHEKKEWVKEHRIDMLQLHGVLPGGVPTMKNFKRVVGVMGGEIYYLADAEATVREDVETILLLAYNTETNAARVIHTFYKPEDMEGPYVHMHWPTLVALPSLH